MSHRFIHSSRPSHKHSLLFSLVLFLFVCFCFQQGLSAIEQKVNKEGLQTLQTAIERCVTRCYAETGSYPESLEYLKTHYGLHYDESQYFVDYQPVGANILPDITIIWKGE